MKVPSSSLKLPLGPWAVGEVVGVGWRSGLARGMVRLMASPVRSYLELFSTHMAGARHRHNNDFQRAFGSFEAAKKSWLVCFDVSFLCRAHGCSPLRY